MSDEEVQVGEEEGEGEFGDKDPDDAVDAEADEGGE
jgi:hypothetical protein